MERGSRIAIYKLKKVTPPNGGEEFYKATVCELVYNAKKPFANKWETAFYDAYIFDTSIELQEADFSLDKNTSKYHFDNISNPRESIIRVTDFKYENHTTWKNRQPVVDDYGKPKISPVFYITGYTMGYEKYVSLETQNKKLEEKILELKALNSSLRRENKEIRRQRKDLNKIIEDKNSTLKTVKKELKDVTEPKVVKQKEYREFDNIQFSDM